MRRLSRLRGLTSESRPGGALQDWPKRRRARPGKRAAQGVAESKPATERSAGREREKSRRLLWPPAGTLGWAGGWLPLAVQVGQVAGGLERRRGWAWAMKCPVGRSLTPIPSASSVGFAATQLTLAGGPIGRPLASADLRHRPPPRPSVAWVPSLRFAEPQHLGVRLGQGRSKPHRRRLARLPVARMTGGRRAAEWMAGSASPATARRCRSNSLKVLAPDG